MMMPRRLVLVRHGESEGNIAVKQSEKGNHQYYTDEFRKRSSRHWRLTDRGRAQAEVTGAWLRERFPAGFGRYYVSDTTRTWETAGHLGLPNASWYNEPDLIERHWGHMDGQTEDERLVEYGRILDLRGPDPFMWRPPGGESLHSVRKRLRWVLDTLNRECSKMDVLIVCHGEVIWCFRTLLERMTLAQFAAMDSDPDPKLRVNNCQVMVYSRINPETAEEEPYASWLYSACPCAPGRSLDAWRRIERPRFTNEDLLAGAESVEQLFSK